MTKEELLKVAEEAKAKIDAATQEAIEKLGKEESVNLFWKPTKGERYYDINRVGEVSYSFWGNDDKNDRKIFGFGNCFQTREEAEEYALRLKYRRMYEAMGRPFIVGKDNYYVYYEASDNTISYNSFSFTIRNDVFFSTERDCKKAIQAIGEDNIKKYILGIKEGTEDE